MWATRVEYSGDEYSPLDMGLPGGDYSGSEYLGVLRRQMLGVVLTGWILNRVLWGVSTQGWVFMVSTRDEYSGGGYSLPWTWDLLGWALRGGYWPLDMGPAGKWVLGGYSPSQTCDFLGGVVTLLLLTPSGGQQNMYSWQVGSTHPTENAFSWNMFRVGTLKQKTSIIVVALQSTPQWETVA